MSRMRAALSMQVLLLLGAAVLLSLIYAGCAGKPQQFQGQILILGFDSATWDIMKPMAENGDLPNIKMLMDNGSYASLKTIPPAESPLIWNSIATGKTPEKHGINSFVARLPREYESIPIDSGKRKTKALWDILTDKGIASTFISWWATWPAEDIMGRMITDRFDYPGLKKATSPEELAIELRNSVHLRPREEIAALLHMKEDPAWADDIKKEYGKYLEIAGWDLQRFDVAEHCIKAGGSRVYSVYFRHLDPVQHLFWKYMEPDGFDVSPEQMKVFGMAVRNYYRLIDWMVGRLVSMMPPDSMVVVLSDHGMASFTPRKMGYMKGKDYIGVEGGHLYLRYPVLNRLLYRLGYLSFLKDGNAVDWSRTSVFADDTEHLDWTRTLIVNSVGVYPNGVVRKKDHEELLKKVSSDLLGLRSKSGKKVVTWTKPDPEHGTIRIKVNPELSMDDVLLFHGISFSAGEIIGRFYNSGEHYDQEGVLIIKGPNIKHGNRINTASVLDITPTVLYSLGLAVGKDMDGRVLEEIFDRGYLKAYPIAYIDSYDQTGWKKAAGADKSSADKDMKEKLKSLGYIQ